MRRKGTRFTVTGAMHPSAPHVLYKHPICPSYQHGAASKTKYPPLSHHASSSSSATISSGSSCHETIETHQVGRKKMPPPHSAIAAVDSSPSLNSSVAAATAILSKQTIRPDAADSVVTILSKQIVFPDAKSVMGDLPLSVSDLPMLSCHYIQKGLLLPPSDISAENLVSLFVTSLSRALCLFPAFAGRLVTLPDDRIVIRCNDAGVEFFHAAAPSLSTSLLLPPGADVPTKFTKDLFPMDRTISYDGHRKPLTAFQLTQLGDGAVFVGVVANHATVDGTSYWSFFNTWAGLCRGDAPKQPDFRRNFFGESTAVLRFPGGNGPAVTFDVDAPLRERILHFSADAIRMLKAMANRRENKIVATDQEVEVLGKLANDPKASNASGNISLFQSLCAQIWRSVTLARKRLPADTTTTFRMAVNCRHRLRPPISADYFGNAIQSVATTATVAELAANDLRWAAGRLHANVMAHGDAAVRKAAAAWEAAPRCFPLGNTDGASLTMGSSNRFPMYDGNDFGWGRPVAVRSGRANKFDGKMSAFPGQAGDGSVDVEVCLAPETMAALLRDGEFMQYVSYL